MMFARSVRSSARHLSTKVGSSNPTFLSPAVTTTMRQFSVKNYQEANSDAAQLKTTFYLPDPTIACSSGRSYHQLTKIVATIGPTSEQEEPLKKVVNAGMKIMRLNFSHATKEEVELRLKNLALSQVRRCCRNGKYTVWNNLVEMCACVFVEKEKKKLIRPSVFHRLVL